jgi:hypothetical protein
MNENDPKTLVEAVRYFSDASACQRYMLEIKWPTGVVTCPKCGGENIGCDARPVQMPRLQEAVFVQGGHNF